MKQSEFQLENALEWKQSDGNDMRNVAGFLTSVHT